MLRRSAAATLALLAAAAASAAAADGDPAVVVTEYTSDDCSGTPLGVVLAVPEGCTTSDDGTSVLVQIDDLDVSALSFATQDCSGASVQTTLVACGDCAPAAAGSERWSCPLEVPDREPSASASIGPASLVLAAVVGMMMAFEA